MRRARSNKMLPTPRDVVSLRKLKSQTCIEVIRGHRLHDGERQQQDG